jgi:catechol 2,3-dioxygenase-like lactoylglutathione lyase family enzyme
MLHLPAQIAKSLHRLYVSWMPHKQGGIMIDHVSIGTRDMARAASFYSACLAPLGYTLQHQDSGQTIYGQDGAWSFCLYPAQDDSPLVGHRSHLAISAPSQAAARGFFEAATALGAATLRIPGPREDINERYFGTIVTDPDGHMIEVVHWAPG